VTDRDSAEGTSENSILDGDSLCADHSDNPESIGVDIANQVSQIGIAEILKPRSLKVPEFNIGGVTSEVIDYPIQEGRNGIPRNPWRSVADALAHVPPQDRVTLVPPRPEIDL